MTENNKPICRHMTSYGACELLEEPCTKTECSMWESCESAYIVRCGQCRHRTEPKCNKADYAAREIAKCGNRSAPACGRLVYLTDFCNYGSGGMV